MWRASTIWACCAALVVTVAGSDAVAQRHLVERAVSEARRTGSEDAVVHLAEEIGAAGVGQCLVHANRAGKLLCAQSARYLEQPWPVLPVLASVLQNHDRQIASRAAESMVEILSRLAPGDLGEQEPLPEEAEELLQGLRGVANNDSLSLDILVQVVTAAAALARVVGAGQEIAREALGHAEVSVRRAAVAGLAGSIEDEDLEALVRVITADGDRLTRAFATAAVCEATAGHGGQLPAPVLEHARELLTDARAGPGVVAPLLSCLARAPSASIAPLRELATRHPNEHSQAAWGTLISEREP